MLMEMILFFRVALTLAELPKQLSEAVRVIPLPVDRVVVGNLMDLLELLVVQELLVKDTLVVLLVTLRLGGLLAVAEALGLLAGMLLAVAQPEMVEQD